MYKRYTILALAWFSIRVSIGTRGLGSVKETACKRTWYCKGHVAVANTELHRHCRKGLGAVAYLLIGTADATALLLLMFMSSRESTAPRRELPGEHSSKEGTSPRRMFLGEHSSWEKVPGRARLLEESS